MHSIPKKLYLGLTFGLATALLATPYPLSAGPVSNNLNNTMVALGPLPDYYPARLDHYGRLEKIVSRNEVIIDGKKYHLDRAVKIVTVTTRYGSHSHLKENTRVGFIVKDQAAPVQTIKAIYVMPVIDLQSIS